MQSFSKPTNELIEATIPLLASPQHERYFLDRLDNPHWITPLREHGFFQHPPAPEEVSGGGVRCQAWPQSRYLVRMASHAPKEVAEILAEIDSDNWIVARDIIEAGEEMRPEYAAKLAPKIGELIEQLGLWYKLDDVGGIAARLARENEADAAVDLVKTAFAIDRRKTTTTLRHRDDYGYFEGLRDSVIPSLIAVRASELLELLIRWMSEAIETEEGRRIGGDDFSYVWRPAIEDHEQNRDFDFAAKLVGCVRDAFELAIRDGHLRLSDALPMLEEPEYLLFRRLHLHLITEFADHDPELARRTMLDRSLFGAYGCKHEHARLMGQRFGLLSKQQQAEWLEWIEAGPEKMEPDYRDESEDDESRQRRREYWQFQKLHWIRDHLTDMWRTFYERKFEEHGKPDLADLHVYSSGGRWGHESPYTAEQLSEMGFEAAVEAVARWRLDPEQRGLDEPTVEGLAGTFQEYVALDALTFSSQARQLEDKPAVYVRRFLRAMEAAVKEGKQIDLVSVLALCEWVLNRPVDEDTSPTNADGGLVERDWQWCRDTIADLLQEICKAKDDAQRPRFGVQHREKLWAVIKPLLNSPTKSYILREDAEKDPRITDWPQLALNSPRGRAMNAVVAYADWMPDHLVEDRKEQRSLPGGFEQMPEVRELLEDQLTRPDDHFTARAAFGWRLGLLFWLDADWLRRHADTIFDLRAYEDDPSKAFGWAAWNTFLFANRPRIEFYRILRDQFSYAVDQAATLEKPQDSREQPFAQLAEHLIVLYGRGDFGRDASEAFDADSAIVKRLVTTTHESVRSHAIEFVGMTLKDGGEDLPKEVVQRFKNLWERYWEAIGAEDAERNPGSYVFGYWFSCGVFDPEWSIVQLEKFVTAARKAGPDHMIMKRLASICNIDPLRSARIVGMLVDGDDEGWRVPSWKGEARTVLIAAMKAGGEAKDVAEQVVDRLGRRGYVEFGELLEKKSDDG
ncbi:MAG: hypothetical protein IH983_06715 [Planctomycetes bacterium]|nr:hypothetical protein [Planctomycetota bacterium]